MHWTDRQTDRSTDRSFMGKFDDYRPLCYENDMAYLKNDCDLRYRCDLVRPYRWRIEMVPEWSLGILQMQP